MDVKIVSGWNGRIVGMEVEFELGATLSLMSLAGCSTSFKSSKDFRGSAWGERQLKKLHPNRER